MDGRREALALHPSLPRSEPPPRRDPREPRPGVTTAPRPTLARPRARLGSAHRPRRPLDQEAKRRPHPHRPARPTARRRQPLRGLPRPRRSHRRDGRQRLDARGGDPHRQTRRHRPAEQLDTSNPVARTLRGTFIEPPLRRLGLYNGPPDIHHFIRRLVDQGHANVFGTPARRSRSPLRDDLTRIPRAVRELLARNKTPEEPDQSEDFTTTHQLVGKW